MPLAAGTRLGAYEILSLIGSGGMGEVYRARDSRLGRDVAIKVLPADVAADHDRLARFEREAQVLASLNHPNIAQIHGVDDSSGAPALVMELVEGPTLADRIAKGPIPLDEALPIAKQIAEALEAAHEQGIIHRDLKPANIKVRPDGTVKVLDFGLAKAFDPVASAVGNLTMSPTLSIHATHAGIILGTAAYMAPEQARGKVVDKRADIWAFGCVVFEMLSGRRAFDGDDISTTLAAVLKTDLDWSALSSDVPPNLRRLLRSCLNKNPLDRLRDIGDARIGINHVLARAVEESAPSETVRRTPWWRRAMPAVIGAASVGFVAGVAWTLKPQPPVSVVRFPIVIPEDQQPALVNPPQIAFAPDGTRVAYVTRGRLFVRALNEMDARLVTDATQGAATGPFFSPDGQWIGFYSMAERALKRVAVVGGAPVTICKVEGGLFGPTWEGDRIVFFQLGKGIMQVPANGGDPEVLIATQASEVMDTPQLLDGGTAVLFTVPVGQGSNRWDVAQVVVQSVGSHERKVVWRGGSAARYLPSGHLVYVVGNVLLAVPFDLKRREVRGAPVSVVEGVLRPVSPLGLVPTFAVSRNGSLIYVPGGVSTTAPSTLALVSRDGSVHPLSLPPQPYHHPRISPDGHNLVFETDDGKEAVIWIYGLSGDGPPRQLTFGGRNRSPIWTPDGRRVTFASDRDGTISLFWQAADGSGTAERLLKGEATTPWRPEAWTPDGKTLAFVHDSGVGDIWTLTPGGESKPKKLVESPANVRYTEFSPDGRWFAYSSTETGSGALSFDIFVQPFPPTGAKYRLTTTGARNALWSPDGKELFYANYRPDLSITAGHLSAVQVRTQPTFSFGKPAPLPIGEGVQFGGTGRQYDITPDGKQFIVLQDASTPGGTKKPPPTQINVVLNWSEELKARVPMK
jgi:serine/threonine-protein kinase